MQFQLGQLPFESKQQTPIGRAWVINAVSISDETASVATDIQQGIPIRAVAREAHHIHGQNDAYLPQRDLGHQFLEASTMRGTRGRQTEIRIDDLNVLCSPAQLQGALLQGVLQAQALLIGEHLVRRRLSNVNECLALQMLWT